MYLRGKYIRYICRRQIRYIADSYRQFDIPATQVTEKLPFFNEGEGEVCGISCGYGKEGGIVHRCLTVGRVGDCSDNRKWCVVDEGNLRHSAALHLAGRCREVGNNSVLILSRGDELIARGYSAKVSGKSLLLRRIQENFTGALIRLKIYNVDARHKSLGIADGRGVHIVLTEIACHNDVTGGNARGKRTANACVDYKVGRIIIYSLKVVGALNKILSFQSNNLDCL